MNNITIGQYVPGDSWIYKMDPRIKIIALVLALVVTFTISSFNHMAVLLVLTLMMILTTGIPFLKMIKGMKALLFLLTFTFVIQVFYVQSGNLLFETDMHLSFSSIGALVVLIVLYNIAKKRTKFKSTLFLAFVFMVFFLQAVLPYGKIFSYEFNLYEGGLYKTGFLLFRILIVVMLSSLLTFTTMPTDLNNGLESVLKPFKVVRFPVAELSMMLSITLRFIPTLLDETTKIMKAQASRGVEFSESKLKDKISQIISLLIPIFVISFKRAEDLANAMEARGYVIGAKRTKIDQMKLGLVDLVSVSILVLLLTFNILVNTGVIHAL
ncbi:ABC transporter subunit, cobalt transport protein (permease subunit) [Paracholeplasma brassicae]|uniref:ABC transporter subunit, cobalt transport protein (Permease subunit) n=1 Tax=Acholeplasma brassicae TaxID=61635 RepID=U4KMG4_9MOLU|nr:energy-coupling factor transporter transmembrane component T [Paracholeplasma brassicae]CCV65290.1 ABC transporter subunit, cobalt transport protein (permease subunit) [Paracholeplasma brassicae]